MGLFLAALAFLLSGCRSPKSPEAKADNRPEITVGCDDYTPFSYLDTDGNVTGIDVELAREAFGRMGYQVNFQFIEWNEKKQLLKNGDIDCIWSSFTMDGRETEYKWAGPYMKSKQVVAVAPDSDIWSLEDLNGKTVALQSSTKPEDIFRSHEASMPKPRKIISVQNRDLIFTFLSKGYADAIAAHATSIDQFMSDFGMEYRILEEPLLTVGLGVAFDLADDRGLDTALSQTLEDMRADGTEKAIIGKYLKNADMYLGDKNDK